MKSGTVGAVLAMVAAVGAIAAGVVGGLSASETFWRAALAAAAGGAAGWVCGKVGTSVVREAAGEELRRPERGAPRPPAGT